MKESKVWFLVLLVTSSLARLPRDPPEGAQTQSGKKHTGHQWLPPLSFLGKTLGGGWGLLPSLLRGWEKFLPASGNSEEQPEPACGLSEARRPGPRLLHLAPAPQAETGLCTPPARPRSAARRSARSSRPDSSRLTCYYAPDAFPRRPVSPRVCASDLSGATAPRSHPLAPSSTQSSLRVQTRCQPCCPGAGKPDPGSGGPGTSRGKWWWPAGGTGGSAIPGSHG